MAEHRSVSNEDDTRETAAVEERRAVSPLATHVESVPGYVPRGAAAVEAGHVTTSEAAEPELQPAAAASYADAAAASFGNADLLEVVQGDDDRTTVPSTLDTPWRYNCALRIHAKNGKMYVGTAWFIGPRTLATAGHCVFLQKAGGWATRIEVIPALDGSRRPFRSVMATKFRAVDGWTVDRNSDFDYGAIILDDDRYANVGAFSFAALPEELLASTNVNIAGYPLDRDRATKQYFHARKLVRISDRRIYYEIDTYGGQSGSAAWLAVDAQRAAQLGLPVPQGAREVRVAIGIHTNGSSTSNHGTRINPEVFANLRRWKGLQA